MGDDTVSAVQEVSAGMSQSEVDLPTDSWSGLQNPFGEDQQGYSGRMPPQDVDAEQSVLGAMMISKDAIADANEHVDGVDFYRPAHEVIFSAIVDLYSSGEPADPITISAELQRRGELGKVGGAPYLHTLSASVPIASNAGYYAAIVREKAVLRRLVDAGTRIAQMGYSGEGQVDDTVDRAQAEIYAITEKRQQDDYLPLKDLLEPTLDEIEAISEHDGTLRGVPTGFTELDHLTNGLQGGQMMIVAARPGMGKALSLDTALPTPRGWTTMGHVQVGDLLYGADGKPTRVVRTTGVMYDRPCYEVCFSDGSTIVADAQHQWLTRTQATRRSGRPGAVVTTEEMAHSVRAGAERGYNHSVANAAPIQSDISHLPVPAYALGTWLGGGDLDAARRAVDCRLDDAAVDMLLHTLGVCHLKHIPPIYQRAPEADRRALLAGLLDGCGSVVPLGGAVRTRVSEERLAADTAELVVGLGYKCTRRTEVDEHGEVEHLVTFATADDVFWLGGNRDLHRELRPADTVRIGRRLVTDVRPVPSVPVRCVEVDNTDHLFLAGRSMIPTHNSTLGLDLCRSASIHNNMTSCFFSLEMSKSEITMRLLSAEAKIPLNHLRNGEMSDDDWNKLVPRMGQVSGAPMFIDDSPNLTMMEIRAKARRLKQRHDLQLIVIDYLQLMSSGKKVESRQLEVSEFSRQIKLLAKELHVPIVALSQLNRGPEQRSDKKPMMSDLRESGSLEQDADIVVLLHREDMYEKESTRPGEADFIVAKHRNGPTRDIAVLFQGHYSRFANLAH